MQKKLLTSRQLFFISSSLADTVHSMLSLVGWGKSHLLWVGWGLETGITAWPNILCWKCPLPSRSTSGFLV